VGANTPVAAQGIGPTPQHTANQQRRHYQQSTHLHTHIGGRWRKLVQQLENVFFDFEKKTLKTYIDFQRPLNHSGL